MASALTAISHSRAADLSLHRLLRCKRSLDRVWARCSQAASIPNSGPECGYTSSACITGVVSARHMMMKCISACASGNRVMRQDGGKLGCTACYGLMACLTARQLCSHMP